MSSCRLLRPAPGARLVLSLFASVLACADCDRDGCDVLTQQAAQNGTGIAGVVAATSDVVEDGCAECPLAEARLELWDVGTPVGSESSARALLQARLPDQSANVSERYRQALSPGRYLVCVRPNCIDVEVKSGETWTVNVKRREGPTSFFAGGAAARLEESFGYDVGY